MKALTLIFSTLMIASVSACSAPRSVMPVMPNAMLQAQASTRVIYHVVPDSKAGVWHVKQQGNAVPVATFKTKAETVAAGREIARAHTKSQLIVHLANGRIETEYTYGEDPRSSKG